MKKGEANARISIIRSVQQDDGLSTVPGSPIVVGQRWAKKTDVSDGERVRASQQGQDLTTRFLVTADSLTRTITGGFQIGYRTAVFDVTGTKEVGDRREDIEITAVTRPDIAG